MLELLPRTLGQNVGSGTAGDTSIRESAREEKGGKAGQVRADPQWELCTPRGY